MDAVPLATAEGLQQAARFLRDVVPWTPRLWTAPLPGVRSAVVTHVEDGWVDLSFHGCTARAAAAVAGELLHPDALATDDLVFALTDLDGLHFQGFGWDDEPPAGVLARLRPGGPPALAVALGPPTA